MADNYLSFSTMIPSETEEQQKYLLERLDDETVCQATPDDNWSVWVYTEEFGDVERLADIVCDFQRNFYTMAAKPWVATFAETCSKPRLDEFSGGAVVCYKGEQHWMNAGSWASEKVKELTG